MNVIDVVTAAGCQPVRNEAFVSLSSLRICEKHYLDIGMLSQRNQTKPADVDVMERRIAWETPLVPFDVQDEALNLMEDDDVFWKYNMLCRVGNQGCS